MELVPWFFALMVVTGICTIIGLLGWLLEPLFKYLEYTYGDW